MIEVFNISKSYGSKQVLENVTFTAENGVITGFVGPNGAGKSTTMRMIAQLETPDAGQAFVDGQEFSRTKQPLQTMGVYLGDDYLPNHMTGEHYLAYVCQVGGISKDRIPSLLEAVQLTGAEKHLVSSYSLGMRQRLGLAAAIAGDADSLMLDEPVNGLDPMGVQWLRGLLKSQASRGKAVLLSSHLLSELELVADKVVMLNSGRVVAQGYLAELASMMSAEKRVLLSTSDDARVVKALTSKGIAVAMEEEGLSVAGVAPQQLARDIIHADIDLYRLEEKHMSLEEMFMARAAQGQSASQNSSQSSQQPPGAPPGQHPNSHSPQSFQQPPAEQPGYPTQQPFADSSQEQYQQVPLEQYQQQMPQAQPGTKGGPYESF